MDSQKRDESRDRRREEALARRVGDALDQLAHRDADECPDAELIAAYHEKSLQPDEIARCENHFAACGRCRKILAVLAAAVEAPLSEQEVAHLGKLVAATRAPAQMPAGRAQPVRLTWRMRWLAPALGLAAVLVVWFAMRPPWRMVDKSPSGILIAQAPKSEPPPSAETRAVEQFSEATRKKSSEGNAVTLKDRPAARVQSTSPPMDALAKNRIDDNRVTRGAAPNSSDAESRLRDEKKEKADLNGTPVSGASRGELGARGAALPAPGSPPPPPPPPPATLLAPRPSNPALASPREAQVQATQQAPRVTAPSPAANQSVVTAETVPASSGTGSGAGNVGNAPAREKQVLTAPVGADKTAALPQPPPLQAPVAGSLEPPPQAQAKAQAPSQPPSDSETPRSTSQTVVVTEAIPLVDTTNSTLGGIISNPNISDLPLNGRNYQGLLELRATVGLPVQVKTPSGTILWRAGMGGKIQRSTDAGRTWILQKSPLQEEWLAGAAASDTMCWIVGRNGAIARTTDGSHWKKIASPRLALDSSGKYPDWISITAASAQTATIAASDQRRYATQDGGKTWKAP
jgi:hypothetical protein